jgi:hypothetical protein
MPWRVNWRLEAGRRENSCTAQHASPRFCSQILGRQAAFDKLVSEYPSDNVGKEEELWQAQDEPRRVTHGVKVYVRQRCLRLGHIAQDVGALLEDVSGSGIPLGSICAPRLKQLQAWATVACPASLQVARRSRIMKLLCCEGLNDLQM